MKIRAAITALLLCSTLAAGQGITVGYQQSHSFAVPGATAAFSLNTFYVDATVEDGLVTVFGKSPGSSFIVVATAAGTQEIQVQVLQPPVLYPPGFNMPRSPAQLNENGSYEFRYSSDPSQQHNVLDFFRRSGDRTTRFHLQNVNWIRGESGARRRVSLPSMYYQVRSPQRDITLLDQEMSNSPLTVQGGVLRGIHFRQGNFRVQAGYSSIAFFQNLVLPVEREVVVGGSYQFRLSESSTLTPNLYWFPSAPHGQSYGRNGAVGAMVYDYRPSTRLRWRSELGVSRGLGVASEMEWEGSRDRLRARLVRRPQEFASLSLNSNRGFSSDAVYTRTITSKLTADVFWTGDKYRIGALEQRNLSGNLNLRYAFNRHWAVFSGLSLADFSSEGALRQTSRSLNLPAGVAYTSKHFGSTLQYTFAENTRSTQNSHGIRATANAGWSKWSIHGFYDRQTHTPTLDLVFTETPGLQLALDRMGLAVSTLQQLAELLRQNALLHSLGYVEGATVNLSPTRTQQGGSVTWSAQDEHRQRLSANFLNSRYESVRGLTSSYVTSFAYSRKLSGNDDLFASYSYFSTRNAAASASAAAASRGRGVFSVSLRHQFETVPAYIVPGKYGAIRGRVFEDPQLTGEHSEELRGIEGVEVVLNGSRSTRTGPGGQFQFTRVPAGEHRVEARAQMERPYFFTMRAAVETHIDREVYIGLAFAKGQLIGYVRNDAGEPLADVRVAVRGQGPERQLHTDGQGRFALENADEGDYLVIVAPDSLPPGYALDELAPASVNVRIGRAGQLVVRPRALRAVSGRVNIFDRNQGARRPLAGVVVRLVELGRESVSDDRGAYLFRDLPAGSYTLEMEYAGEKVSRRVDLPGGPALLREINLELGGGGGGR